MIAQHPHKLLIAGTLALFALIGVAAWFGSLIVADAVLRIP